MRLAICLFAVATANAAIDGVVMNQTAGGPQAGATVNLVKLGAGMENAGSTKTDAQGRFSFDVTAQPGAPYLVQAVHEQVNYSKMLQPGAAMSGVQIDVFDSVAKAGEAKVSQHMILLEPTGSELQVSESIIYTNSGRTTFNDTTAGTLRFYVPGGAEARVSVTPPNGMPVQRPAEKASAANTYFVRYPIKPGETRFDLSYVVPGATTFESRILHGGGPLRIVAPRGVKLVGDALSDLGPEPRTQATVYDVKASEYKLAIEGTGSLRAATEGSAPADAAAEDSGPSIEAAKPRIYDKLPWILGLSAAMLAVGFVILYRSDAPAGRG